VDGSSAIAFSSIEERESVITRIWRGWTRPEDTDAYAAYILETGIAAYRATPGNQGAYLMSRPEGDRTEFLTVSFWDSLESITRFAGDDIERAVFYPEDDEFLLDRETTAKHYRVH
jgi:heme-degrading monooxygenase HmoA